MSAPVPTESAPLAPRTKRQLWRAITTLCRAELRKGAAAPRAAWRRLMDAADAMAAAAVVAAASSAAGEHVGDAVSVRRKRERTCRKSGCKPSSRCGDCVTSGFEIDGVGGGRVSRWRERSVLTSAFGGRFRQHGEALRHFRLIARLVILCGKWVSPLTRQRDKQIRSFVDVAKELEGSMRQRQLDTAGSVFNRTDYSPEKELTISKDVERLLQLSRDERSDEMVKQMVISLRTLQAFAEYPIHIQEQLCRVAEYHVVPPGRVIVRAGHRGECFYIIISGRGQAKAVVRNAGTGEVKVDCVNNLRRGQKFGDEALLRRTERTATVESVTTMRLLAIEKSDFAEIFMKENANNKEPEYMSFLRKVDFLKYFPLDRLKSCGDHCVFQYFSSGKVVVTDSLSSDYIYIVKSGSCAVLKQLRAELTGHGSEPTPAARRAVASRGPTRNLRRVGAAFAQATDEDTDCSSDSSSRRRQPRRFAESDAAACDPAAASCRRKKVTATAATGQKPVGGVRHTSPAVGCSGGKGGGSGGGDHDSASERAEIHPYTPSIAVPRNECPPTLPDAGWLSPPPSSSPDFSSESEEDKGGGSALDDARPRTCRRHWKKCKRGAASRSAMIAAKETVSTGNDGGAGSDYLRLDLFRRRRRRRGAAAAVTATTGTEKPAARCRKPALTCQGAAAQPPPPPPHDLVGATADGGAAQGGGRLTIRPLTEAALRRSYRSSESDRLEQPMMQRAHTELLPGAAVARAVNRDRLLIPRRSGDVVASAALGGSTAGTRRDSSVCLPLPPLAESGYKRDGRTAPKAPDSDRPPLPTQPHPMRRFAYVQLAVLKPTDAFGLDTLAFDPHFRRSSISVSLVSNGAELILLSKKYFLQHCDERTLGHLRTHVAPSPTERQLRLALTRLLDWDVYKKSEMACLTASASAASSPSVATSYSRSSGPTAAQRSSYAQKLVPTLLQRYTF